MRGLNRGTALLGGDVAERSLTLDAASLFGTELDHTVVRVNNVIVAKFRMLPQWTFILW